MRWIGTLVVIAALMSLCGVAAVSGGGATNDRPWMEPRVEPALVFDEHCCSCDDCDQNGCDGQERPTLLNTADRPESETSRERMVLEVETLWDLWFDDEKAPLADPRRERFAEFAGYLVDAVLMYQDAPTDIGGRMPGGKDDHLMVAYMVAKESSVTYDAVGTSHGEVGLLQIHGRALAGYSPDKVQHNPKLGLLLGVRWLASQIPKCQQEGSGSVYGDEFAWETSDWIGPLSLYAGGPNGRNRDGSCARFQSMKERIDAVRMYRTRVDYELKDRED